MSVEQQGNQQQTPEASNDVIDALSEALEPVRRSYQPATHQKGLLPSPLVTLEPPNQYQH